MKKLNMVALAGLLITLAIGNEVFAATNAEEFVQKASISGKFEIDSSKVALEKSSSADVKAFAQQMIDDHTAADKKLKATVSKAKVSDTNLAKALDEKHQKILDELKSAKAEDFDKDYIKAQEDAHDDAVSLFKEYSEDGDNEALKAFASQTLPTLEKHKEHVGHLKDKK